MGFYFGNTNTVSGDVESKKKKKQFLEIDMNWKAVRDRFHSTFLIKKEIFDNVHTCLFHFPI